MQTKLELQDHGQDFLWFVLDGDTIIETGPFQGFVWNGRKVLPPKKWRRGSIIVWQDGGALKYPVVKATRVEARTR